MKIKYYNILQYINKLKETSGMLLNDILSPYHKSTRYELSSQVNDYLHYIDDVPFYITPEFTQIASKDTVHGVPRFVFFSAPGAVGKTALAKHISYEYGALYWNLAKLKIGTNSFVGTLVKAVSAAKYSSFMEDLKSGDALMAIDAFDEAELISGRQMLTDFLSDIGIGINGNTIPTVFLFARTESANYLAAYCDSQSIPYLHYEIGYLSESEAKTFICATLSNAPTLADKQCVNDYYSHVKTNIPENECEAFLGYAPVLEVVSKHIKSEPNRSKLISSLKKQNSSVGVIVDIMRDLLIREQSEKVVPALRMRCEEKNTKFNDWDSLYSEEEQVIRLIYYVLFGDCRYDNYPLDFLPSSLEDDYQFVLDSFVYQHPFLRNSGSSIDFAGPAFKEYTLTCLFSFRRDNEALLYFDEFRNKYIPSQIFFDCYAKLMGSVVKASHLPYVFESFKAKATAKELSYVQCAEALSDDTSISIFEMISNDVSTYEKIFELQLDTNSISFDNISNIVLDLPTIAVSIGHTGGSARISNSTLNCKCLIWSADNITIDTVTYGPCLLMCSDHSDGRLTKFEIIGDDLKVSIPNIHEFFKLIPYKYKPSDENSFDMTKFVYEVRGIMMEFRVDKKDTLGKHNEKIDHVVVGGNSLRREILDYLLSKDILYLAKSENQYKVNIPAMKSIGMSYSDLYQMHSDKLKPVFDDFLSWRSMK